MIRPYFQEDYDQIASLAKDWNSPLVPKEWIPETSLIVADSENIIVFGSAYQLGHTPIYWFEGIISNKRYDPTKRKHSIDQLIAALYQLVKSRGAQAVLASTPRDSLKETFIQSGFTPAPEQYHHLRRI